MRLYLAMIVRDEEQALPRTLASLRGVFDGWCILDTGSADRTWALAGEAVEAEGKAGRAGFSGVLREATFDDYASSRNRAFDLVPVLPGERSWVVSLSADEVLVGGEALRDFLTAYAGEESALLLEVRTPAGAFDYPRVLCAGGPWRYEGVIHEEPVCQVDRSRRPVVKVPGCRVEYAPTDPERLLRRLRERDVPLLQKQLAGTPDPTRRARVVSLLAQTQSQIAQAIQGDVLSSSQAMFSALGYHAFLAMDEGAPLEARRESSWRFLHVAEMLGIYLPRELVPRLSQAVEGDPRNPALAYLLAQHTADLGEDGRVRGDAREGLRRAQQSARCAADAVSDPKRPHDPHGLLWRSHFIAACCARVLGHGPAAKRSAEAGLSGGGPPEVFAPFLK